MRCRHLCCVVFCQIRPVTPRCLQSSQRALPVAEGTLLLLRARKGLWTCTVCYPQALLTRRRQPHPLPVSGQLVEVGTGLIVASRWPAPRPPHALEVVTHLCVPLGRHDKGRLDHDALAAAAASALGHRGRRVWHWRLALAFRWRCPLGFNCILPSLPLQSSLGGGQLQRLHCGAHAIRAVYHSWQVSRVVGAGNSPRELSCPLRKYAATRASAYLSYYTRLHVWPRI